MKKIWSAPEAIAEQFAANEYVAACGDQNKVYKFVCDAPAGTIYYYKKSVSDGTIDGVYNGTGDPTMIWGSYTPCDAKHEAPTTADFFDGFVDRNWNGKCDDKEAAIIWRGPNNNNGHATAQLNMDEWETAKS